MSNPDSFIQFIENHLLPGDEWWGEVEPELNTVFVSTWRQQAELYAQDFPVWEAMLPDEYTGMMDAITKYLIRNPPESTQDAIQKAAYLAWRLQQVQWSGEEEDDDDDDLEHFGF